MSKSYKLEVTVYIIIIIIWRFVSAPITVKNIGAWQYTRGRKGYAKLRENKIVLSFRLKTERETTVVWCALEVDSMPLDQNVKTPVLRISSELSRGLT